jgi:hypothetical protein
MEKVFQADWDAVEHSPVAAAQDFLLSLSGLFHGQVSRDRDVCIDFRLETLDAIQ